MVEGLGGLNFSQEHFSKSERLEFELTYYDIAVQHFSHSIKQTPTFGNGNVIYVCRNLKSMFIYQYSDH